MNLKDKLLAEEKILKNLFCSNSKKKLSEFVKMEKKFQKPYLMDYDLLTVQDLWQAPLQILLIILLK